MKVMVNSIPKGGTHLLLKLVYMLGIPDDPKRFWLGAGIIRRRIELLNKLVKGSFSNDTVIIGSEVPVKIGVNWLIRRLHKIPDNHSFGAHCLHSDELSKVINKSGVRAVCIIRDPRAIAASHMHYVKTWKKHFFHSAYMKLPSDKERMRLSITGGQLGKYSVISMRERYESFLGWQKDSSAMLVRFEDLVGENGGGSNIEQVKAVRNVAGHLDIELSDAKLALIQKDLFGRKEDLTQSSTFRKGKVDAWCKELDEELISMVEVELADILKLLGYID